MPLPVVPPQSPGQSIIDLPNILNPYLGVWWSTQTMTNIPEHVMGWLVAQGFQITGVAQDNTTVPPTNTYALTRQGMQPLEVLLSLCNSYTIAANEARTANEGRYNEVVANWTNMVTSSQTQFQAQVDEQNAQAAVYLGDLGTYMSEIETLIAENRNQIVLDAQTAKAALDAMDANLSMLETNAQNNTTLIGALLTAQDGYLSSFLTSFIAKLNELDAEYAEHLTSVLANISSLETVASSHITAYSAGFAALSTNYSSHAGTLGGLLTTAKTNTDTFVTDVTGILTALATDYTTVSGTLDGYTTSAGTLLTAHATDYNTVLALLLTDYDAHVITATGFLTNLGATELARINSEFASTLSTQIQMLIDRGLHSAAVATDITERNHRDRDEQIQMLNDRLNREKWENQHRLYEQQVAMRARTLDGKDRIHALRQEILRYQASQVTSTYSLLQEMRNRTIAGKQAILNAQDANSRLTIEVQSGLYAKLQDVQTRINESLDRIYQVRDTLAKWKNGETHLLFEELQRIQAVHLAGIEKQHMSKQEVSRTAMGQRDALLAQIQDALKGLLTGKERYAGALIQQASTVAEHKHRAIVERMNTAVQRLEGWSRIADQNRQLLAYQLDTRNQLLIGLYSFVERRDDIGPEWKDAAQMIAALGDAGGNWTVP